MIHRLITIRMNQENFAGELNSIKRIAVNNRYKLELIDSSLMRIRSQISQEKNYGTCYNNGSNNFAYAYHQKEFGHNFNEDFRVLHSKDKIQGQFICVRSS